METLIEPTRLTTSFFALVTVIAMVNALKGAPRERIPILRVVSGWLALTISAGLVFTHVLETVPKSFFVPLVAFPGMALGIVSLFSSDLAARFAALEDRQWRMLMLLRGVFGALILSAGALGLLPIAFARPAGLGDLLVGGLAVAVPGSLAAGGHRGFRLLVFGIGLLDFINVIGLQIRVLVPWLAETHSVGISLLLPWVVVPLLATLNLSGVRQVLKEMAPVAAKPA